MTRYEVTQIWVGPHVYLRTLKALGEAWATGAVPKVKLPRQLLGLEA